MPAEPPIRVIVNERAGGGSMHDAFRRIEHDLFDRLGEFEVRFTERPGHATELAREALLAGRERVVVAGGDGTIHEVVNGWLDEAGKPLQPDATLIVLAGGTGGDLRRTLGIDDMETALRSVAAGRTRLIDVGRVTLRANDGRSNLTRYFANVVSFGLAGKVVHSLDGVSGLAGRFAYAAGAVRALVGWRDPSVRISLDGPDGHFETEMPMALAAIGNGRFFGGGMEIAPGALIDDGLLQVTIVGKVRKRDYLGFMRALYSGAHMDHPAVIGRSAATVSADADTLVHVEVDGEPLGQLPASFDLVPGAVRVAVP